MNNRTRASFSPARLAAMEIVYNVMENSAYCQVELDRQLEKSKLGPEDRRLTAEISLGTIRMTRNLDWHIDRHLKKGVQKQNPWLRSIFRISAYQLIYMKNIPAYACVNDAVALSRHRIGQSVTGLVNAVLRRIVEEVETGAAASMNSTCQNKAMRYSMPDLVLSMLLETYNEEQVLKMFEYYNQPAVLHARVNLSMTNPVQLKDALEKEGIRTEYSPFLDCSLRIIRSGIPPQQSQVFQSGQFYLQNEGSMLAAGILAPEPGAAVLDLACGTGGKTLHLAELAGETGLVDAIDLYDHKLAVLQAGAARMGYKNVRTWAADLLEYESSQAYDRVLLDAPCSGLGVLGRRADLRWKIDPQSISQLCDLQSSLLARAAAMVKSGGRLVYSTCTLNPAENQAVARSFLDRNPGFVFDDFSERIMAKGLAVSDREECRSGMWTLAPGKYGTDGMFFACFRKV